MTDQQFQILLAQLIRNNVDTNIVITQVTGLVAGLTGKNPDELYAANREIERGLIERVLERFERIYGELIDVRKLLRSDGGTPPPARDQD